MRLTLEDLFSELRTTVDEHIKAAALPGELPWSQNITVRECANGAGAMARFADGNYEVTVDQFRFVIDLGCNERTCRVTWEIAIDSQSGTVVAFPKMAGKLSGNAPEMTQDLMGRMGLEARKITVLGPLERLFPSSLHGACKRYGVNNPWLLCTDSVCAREEFRSRL